ncbi:MAG: hypothetical protein QOE26_1375 [Verrucomicrobiota bacterium]|jgi:uncharacterized delta-60 repeat protein
MFRLLFHNLALVGSLCCSFLTLQAADPVSPRNANGSISKAVPQSDGKVVVVGSFSYIGNVEKAGIARLNVDGTLDPTFDPGTGANGAINLVAAQSDGKVLIVGPFTSVNGTARNGVARLNADGKLDSTFNPGAGISGPGNGAIFDLQIDSGGKAVLAGGFDSFNNVTRHMLVRLNLDGSVDPTFDAGKNLIRNNISPVADGIKRFSFYPDGQLVVIGYFQAGNRYDLARVAVDGTIDQTFQTGGVSNAAVAAQPDGRVLIGDGFVNSFTGGLNRLNADGQTDITFHATANRPTVIRLQPDGRILLLDFTLRRLNYDGSSDSTFRVPQIASGNSASATLAGMELQPDGRILIYGSFNRVNGIRRTGVAWLLPDGSVDPTFVPDPSVIATGFARNFSTRLVVGTGEFVLIGGFIVDGTSPKKVMIRAIGPSLATAGVPTPSADPRLSLRDSSGAEIARNDNWQQTQIGGVITSDQASEIQASGLAPKSDSEAAMIVSLAPGQYTAVVEDAAGQGTALVEMYDLDGSTTTRVANISTRGGVGTGDNVMIGGAILGGTHPTEVLVRALGPSLTTSGVISALQDPNLTLYNANGFLVGSDENWKDNQRSDIENTGAAPTDDREAAILAVLQPGNYTAVVRGKNNTTGIALVEFYGL